MPDNPRYEGSQKLLFDEHNHPVSKQQEQEITRAQRDRCRWRRFYKAVLLLHADRAGERFVVAGLAVLKDNLANHPEDRDTLLALVTLNRDAGDISAALEYSAQLTRLAPTDRGLADLVADLRRRQNQDKKE